MSIDIEHISSLFHVVEKAALFPKLSHIGAIATRELEAINADAKKEHEELMKKDAEEATKAKAKADEYEKNDEGKPITTEPGSPRVRTIETGANENG